MIGLGWTSLPSRDPGVIFTGLVFTFYLSVLPNRLCLLSGGGRIDPSIGSRDRQIVEPPPITFFSKPILNCSLMAPSPKDDSSSTQPVVFTTQTTYLLPAQKFMIPTTWKRYQLSQLVNKALSLTTPVPFDFLVRGEILRGTLAEWCHENGVGEVRSTMSIDGLHGFG